MSALDKEQHIDATHAHLDEETVSWAYRLFLDRSPESTEVVQAKIAAWNSVPLLRQDMLSSEEFRQKNPHLTPRIATTVVITEITPGLRLYADLSDYWVGLQIVRHAYEPIETNFVRRHVKPGYRCLDIGANIGYFTMIMADIVGAEGKVYSFEPVERSYNLLEKSIRENRFEQIVSSHRNVVSHKKELCNMVYAPGSSNHGGAHLQTNDTPLDQFDHESVRSIILDDLIDEPVDFIKMDIEGAEPLAVRGMTHLLEQSNPIIITEIHEDLLQRVSGCSGAEYVSLLADFGFQGYSLCSDGEIGDSISCEHSAKGSVISAVFMKEKY